MTGFRSVVFNDGSFLAALQHETVAVALFMLITSASASAQYIVWDPTNYVQNAMTAAQTVQSVIQQVQSYATQIRQYEMEVRQLAAMPANAINTIKQIRNVNLSNVNGYINSLQSLYTTFLFDGWLKFMIGAGMMQVVGAIMIKITNILVTTMTTIAAGSTATNVILYVVLVVLAFIISYLMAEINGIAMGLLQGGSRVGFGFNSFSNLKNYGPHKGMGYAGGKTAALAGRGAKAAGAAVGNGAAAAGNAARRGLAAGYNRMRTGGGSSKASTGSGSSRGASGSSGGGVRATMAQARNGGDKSKS